MAPENVIEKVRKLLRLGESDNPHESASAIAMAQRIMAENRITAAEIELEAPAAAPREEVRGWENPLDSAKAALPSWKGRLALILAKANGCQVYRSGPTLKIIGRASRVEEVRYLYTYCAQEVERITRRRGHGNGRTWANNFRLGCVDAIKSAIDRESTALRAELREKARAAGTMALVKLDNALAVTDGEHREAAQFGRIHLGLRSRSGGSHRHDGSARESGRSAGAGIYPGNGAPQVGGGALRIKG